MVWQIWCEEEKYNISEISSGIYVYSYMSINSKITVNRCITYVPLLSEVCTLASLILVMPVNNVVSEHSFSSLQRLKSYLRSTMSQTS